MLKTKITKTTFHKITVNWLTMMLGWRKRLMRDGWRESLLIYRV